MSFLQSVTNAKTMSHWVARAKKHAGLETLADIRSGLDEARREREEEQAKRASPPRRA